PVTAHNVPDVFYDFMNQRGTIYENDQYRQGQVFNWLSAMGYPLTEPYWIQVSIGGKPNMVLMQAFQRRVLTYNPSNAPEWRVEMGNVGLQYHTWRYGSAAEPPPAPTGGIPLTITHIQQSDILKTGQYSGIQEPLYQAIANQQAWSDLWTRHTSTLDAYLPVPAVDFKSNFVIAAFWGNKPNGCYTLKIESVALNQGSLHVTINQIERTGGCTQVIVQPNDLVLVPRAVLAAGQYTVSFVDTGGREIAARSLTLP
ncbi:MAG TPA: protease complex subunit PrcB family protein, partial [Chloroflexia bacterium]|nr:protease complex subunit PrcB family protein [Chloroflexia bacterium]